MVCCASIEFVFFLVVENFLHQHTHTTIITARTTSRHFLTVFSFVVVINFVVGNDDDDENKKGDYDEYI